MHNAARPRAWNTIRGKMLFIVLFLGVFSTVVGIGITLVYLNVVLRRESAYIIEERVNAIVDTGGALEQARHVQLAPTQGLGSPQQVAASPSVNASAPSATAQRLEILDPDAIPSWIGSGDFNGIIVDHDRVEVRALRHLDVRGRRALLFGNIPIDPRFLKTTAESLGLRIMDLRTQPVSEYRETEGLAGEIIANFVPGSGRPVPVIITARDWSTGSQSDWVLCRIRLNYSHTLSDLSRMGLRPASWLMPLVALSLSLLLVYAAGIYLCLRFSHRIVGSVNALSSAAHRIGAGDFSVAVPSSGHDQLGELASSFNNMTEHLRTFREHERQALLLESDLALASEVQRYFTPTKAAALRGGTVWSTSTPARRVSGDLHEILLFSNRRIGLLCADVSGKGVSSALIMAHLQGLVHAHLHGVDQPPSPCALAEVLSHDLYERFKQSRYATFFYGEVDLANGVLTYVNAGHCYPLLISQGNARFLPDGDLPLGLFADTKFREHTVRLEGRSTFIVYSDGVTEALNAGGEQFGERRLTRSAMALAGKGDANHIGEVLCQELSQWSDGVEQFDDATLLILDVNGKLGYSAAPGDAESALAFAGSNGVSPYVEPLPGGGANGMRRSAPEQSKRT